MNTIEREAGLTQAYYAKQLRPLLPPQAFLPDRSKIAILVINLAILGLGWGMAHHLERWGSWLPLFLPFTLIMGNSVIVLLFSTHDLLHSRVIRHPALRHLLSFLGLTLLWMPPTLWKTLHNHQHHLHTNDLPDPDRSYLYQHPVNWGKWIQNLFVPSAQVNPFCLAVGMGHAWGIYAFRNLISVLLFNNGSTTFPPAAFTVKPRQRLTIGLEYLLMLGLHLSVLFYLEFDPLKLLLAYFLPLWIGHSGVMFYIYTNHMLCPMTEVNDPLLNTLSIRVPQWVNLLHLNFSFHTEHHIFPGINSDYYPMVQSLLLTHFPEQFHRLDALQAWNLLLHTPRHYINPHTFTDWTGSHVRPCPFSRSK